MPFASLAEVEEFEKTPYRQRIAASNVYDLLTRTAARHPDKPAIHYLPKGTADDPATTYTYRQFIARITQSANLFRALGAGPDDVVSLVMPILPETFFCLWGAETAAIANPINHYLEAAQIVGIMAEAKAKILVTCDPSIVPDIWPKLADIRAKVPTLRHIVVVGGRPAPDALRYEDEIGKHDASAPPAPRHTAFEDVAALFHTGGTTGTPKLAQHTQGGLVMGALTNGYGLLAGPDDLYFNGLPLFHVGGAICAGLNPMANGCTTVLLSPLGMRNPLVIGGFWKLVERFRPSMVGSVPTVWGALMNVPFDGADISSIRLANCGGSPMPVELAKAVQKRLGVKVVEGFGMTETHGFASMNPGLGEPRIGSIGHRLPYVQLIVAELDGNRIKRRCGPDEQGVVLMRGPQIFKGYVSPAHDRDAWVAAEAGDPDQGRWLNSGDLGRIDADDFIWLTGRAKDLIIRGGHNIDPLVIEETLHQHEAVESAAAVGRPDRHAGELPMAYVQLKPGHKVTGEELQAFARTRVPERASAPVEVVLLELMPTTGVGKIFKPTLRHDAAQRTFARILEPLRAEGIEAEVGVGPHKEFGTLATVKLLKAADRAAAKAKIGDLLGGFSIRHEVV
ncbi:MAG: acyl-CoA synthetase [Reyranellaceae bacterium]